jgi:hypothetical protein
MGPDAQRNRAVVRAENGERRQARSDEMPAYGSSMRRTKHRELVLRTIRMRRERPAYVRRIHSKPPGGASTLTPSGQSAERFVIEQSYNLRGDNRGTGRNIRNWKSIRRFAKAHTACRD